MLIFVWVYWFVYGFCIFLHCLSLSAFVSIDYSCEDSPAYLVMLNETTSRLVASFKPSTATERVFPVVTTKIWNELRDNTQSRTCVHFADPIQSSQSKSMDGFYPCPTLSSQLAGDESRRRLNFPVFLLSLMYLAVAAIWIIYSTLAL